MKTLARFPLPLIVLITAFLLLWAALSEESYPSWDAAFYYAYARSIVFDGDLKIDNDLRLSNPTASPDYVNKEYDKIKTETGRVASPFAFGSALFWLPGLFVLRGAAAVGQLVNILPEHLSGFEWYFAPTISNLSALLGLLAFWLGYLVAYRESSRTSALAATLTLLVTTPLIYYQFREPLYSHNSSAFANAIVIYLWWRSYRKKPSYKQALLLGGAIGLSALVRWQNIIYVVVPVVTSLWWWLELESANRRHEWKRLVGYLALVGLSVLAIVSLQFSHWRLLYDSLITVPQGSTFVDWTAPYLIQILFSPFRGLLAWMPVSFLAVIGLILMIKKRPRLVVPLLVLILVTLYVNSSSRDWFAGGGYGPRRFTSELVILIIGYSGFIQAIPEKARKPFAAILGVGLFLHQWILLRFGLEERIGGRVVSMHPEFRWSEVSYGEFSKAIGNHISDIVASPREFFVRPLSPIGELIDGRWPGNQIAAFLMAATILLLGWLLFRLVQTRVDRSEANLWWGGIGIGVIILLANIWIWNWA